MTLRFIQNIWLSDDRETDCKDCGLRYFSECVRCKELTCNWCSFVCEVEKIPTEIHVCMKCQVASREGKKDGTGNPAV